MILWELLKYFLAFHLTHTMVSHVINLFLETGSCHAFALFFFAESREGFHMEGI
jgi:hypothetical protein